VAGEPASAATVATATRRGLVALLVVLGTTASAGVTGWLVGSTARSVAGDRNAPWIVGRAAGLSSYLVLVALVATGLVLSHPGRARLRRPRSATRIRLHVSLAVFTLALTTLHVVVLATDSFAHVGWGGTLIPMGSAYRPVPVTLGVIGAYAGLLAGVTAALSGRRLVARAWWPIHKIASVSLLLVWAHGVTAGIDTPSLLALYLATGGAVLALAMWRYVARTPAELVDELVSAPGWSARHGMRAVGSSAGPGEPS
jgi:hypothetical protein